MRIIYLDCSMGAAGDMLMAALYELLDNKEEFLRRMAALGLPGIEISAEPAVKCGVTGTHMRVLVHGEEEAPAHHHDHAHAHEHHHTGLHEIERRIAHLDLPKAVRDDALDVYRSIADAEARVHGAPVDAIHFHEVGTLDALADVVGVCLLVHMLAPDAVYASPVHVGSGQVHCAHGILPVPAPATALLLTGIPIYSADIRGELCTPTGAALLRRFVTKFGPMPVLRLAKTGYGMGTKDFPAANCVRAMLGETDGGAERVVELACNLDDMTPEDIAFALERLLEDGALDAFTTPIGMKKSRPGVLLRCLCREDDREAMVHMLLQHTTTLGVRAAVLERYTLARREEIAVTPYGDVRVKVSSGFGVTRRKPEYDDLARIARETGKPIAELRELV